ncbi:MAG: hypothetical protein EA421_02125 [Gemmatimonadales bacterium]|nr:MAG: hypothetical protein EA421_02125 [Gemmatimonadales bacterium]
MKLVPPIFLALILAALIVTPGWAQGVEGSNAEAIAQEVQTSDASAFDAAVTSHQSELDRTREELSELLAHDAVREFASERGMDMERVEEVASTLSDQEVQGMAGHVSEAVAAAQNRTTLTISATTLIIVLLILILVT